MDEKESPSIPLLVPLLTYPLRTFGSSHSDSLLDAYTSLFQHIFTLPLLPNRFPLASLIQFSANLPFTDASVLSPSLNSVLGVEEKVHLLANIAAFTSPRYATLPSASLIALLRLLTAVMRSLPIGALGPDLSTAIGKQVAESESDSDSEEPIHISVSSVNRVSLSRLDERTAKRLQILPSPTHISSLVRATQNHTMSRIAFCDFLFALCSAWPLRSDSVLSTIVVSTSGGFVRELYRGYVRSSPLGKDVSLGTLLGMSFRFYLITIH